MGQVQTEEFFQKLSNIQYTTDLPVRVNTVEESGFKSTFKILPYYSILLFLCTVTTVDFTVILELIENDLLAD